MEDSGTPAKQQVVVTDVQMPFSSMVRFMVKWAFASIPAALILLVVVFAVGMMLSLAFTSIGTFLRHSATSPAASSPANSPADVQEATKDESRPAATTAPDRSRAWEIQNVGLKEQESNNTWTKYAYVFDIKNDTGEKLVVDATAEFLDLDGFVVDEDSQYSLVIEAGQTQTFRGTQLITAAVVERVNSVNIKAKRKN